jgi:hypothetical protein
MPRFDELETRLDRFEKNTSTQFGLMNDGPNKLDARMDRLDSGHNPARCAARTDQDPKLWSIYPTEHTVTVG